VAYPDVSRKKEKRAWGLKRHPRRDGKKAAGNHRVAVTNAAEERS